MIKINVLINNIKWFSYIKNPSSYLDRKLYKLNLKDKIFKKKNIFCTLLLSDSKEIKLLNKKFRKKNKATDVLSFPFQEKSELKKNIKKEKEDKNVNDRNIVKWIEKKLMVLKKKKKKKK